MGRIKVLFFIFISFALILIFGLAHLQIVRYAKYRVMSEDNRLKLVLLKAPRGTILDRNGKAIVKDVLSFNLSIVYNRIKDKDALAGVINKYFNIPKSKILEDIKKSRWRPFSPICIAEDIGTEKAIHMEEIELDYPGLAVEVSTKRKYLYGNSAAALVGYLGLINSSEFEKLKHYGYYINDLVGRSGIEEYYDNYLRGYHGGKQIEVDHRGREMTVLGILEPVPGKDVQLTIDADLQKYCDGLLVGKRGAIIAMSPRDGAVLAMASAPSFDPSIFIDKKRNREVRNILRNPEHPLMNRAITGVYPPGSVFKAVVASAALATRSASSHKTFNCPGYFMLGRARINCWKDDGHGQMDMADALKNSCNVYFVNLGLLLGENNIYECAKRFEFGSCTGIDLPAEKAGILPNRDWKKKNINDEWYKGDTANYSIGQGYLLSSPIQVAKMMSVFANGGYLVKPYIVEKVGDVYVEKEEGKDLGLSVSTLNTVREGLRRVVNDPKGTGMKAKLEDVVVAGKTGTAQTGKNRDHGWFAGFAPFDDARLTVVVFDEFGGRGGYYAAETAGKVFAKAEELGILTLGSEKTKEENL
ncbi:MAG: penicillin-binding protein 2 [Candidatus Omnitrophica bacterium]|nr:penicillin-binding protein 2 [Candidatus Omnitrophota bacterium]